MSSQLSMFDDIKSTENKLPHPIQLSKDYQFQLRYTEAQPEILYCVQDWIMGLAGCTANEANKILKRAKARNELYRLTVHLPLVASNGKTYQFEHTDQWGLYTIAQNMRVIKTRPIIQKVKDYLVDAGVYVDAIVTNKDDARGKLQDILAIDNPERGVSAAIEGYEKRGKQPSWIARRVKGIEIRSEHTQVLAETSDSTPAYAAVTDVGYYESLGMVKRELVRHLGLTVKEANSLRDYLGEIALQGIGMYELAANMKMKQIGRALTPDEQIDIVRFCARSVAPTIEELAQYLGVDKLTDRPLLGE
jgi:hypothetical protein